MRSSGHNNDKIPHRRTSILVYPVLLQMIVISCV